MYEVIQYFTDLQDFNHPYKVGDTFPRSGMTVSDERLSELSGSQNKQHKPLIRLVTDTKETETESKETEQESAEEAKVYTKSEINGMRKEDLVSLATKAGIENAEESSGTELKKALIEYFKL